MAAFTITEAKARLQMWLEAETAVATGQSYQMGSRKLERANLYQIREQIKMWRGEVERLERNNRRKTFRITLRDI